MARNVTSTEVLDWMRTLIDDPRHWTQDRIALAQGGEPTSAYSPQAVCFCVTGAQMRALFDLGLPTRCPVSRATGNRLREAARPEIVSAVNAKGHKEALALIDRALALGVGDSQ